MKYILTALVALGLCACSKEKEALPDTATEEVQVMVYATHGSDTTAITNTQILRVQVK